MNCKHPGPVTRLVLNEYTVELILNQYNYVVVSQQAVYLRRSTAPSAATVLPVAGTNSSLPYLQRKPTASQCCAAWSHTLTAAAEERCGANVNMEDTSTSAKVSDLDGSAPESTDYANYFCTYAYLYHQVHSFHRRSLDCRYRSASPNPKRHAAASTARVNCVCCRKTCWRITSVPAHTMLQFVRTGGSLRGKSC